MVKINAPEELYRLLIETCEKQGISLDELMDKLVKDGSSSIILNPDKSE